ncbi:MAG TPA: hypothetical protein VL856_13920 [Acidimicrobiia bacterium]|jgi:hypothetical protein|nr:hypothetical protein [Acidimicrobiia bacterium]
MAKRTRRLVGVGILAAIVIAVWRFWQSRAPQRPRDIEWASAPFPFPPVPRPAAPPKIESIEPNEDGSCPATHPIKGKAASGIYHVPGGANYERTHADRCYVDEEQALRDGMRRSKI